MIELIIGAAILAGATAIFRAFWDIIYDWCLKQARRFITSFTTFVKVGLSVISYYYHRESDGWYKQEVPAEKVNVDDCPWSVRNALFDNQEVVVKRY